MPRGIPKSKPISTPAPAPAPITTPPPLILLQPGPDGIQFTSYGLETAEIIESLRLALIHAVARHAGVTVIDESISRNNRILKVAAVPVKARDLVATPAPSKPKRLPEFAELRKPAFDEDDDEDHDV